MSEALVVEFDVSCPAADAFDLWTARTSVWWPTAHTITGTRGVEIVIEPLVGGRIFERAPDGVEHTWGSVVGWEPPRRLAFTWHLGQDAATPTDVEITFVPLATDRCHVVIHHDGWERVGADAPMRRERNRHGWQVASECFAEAGVSRG